MNKLPSQVRKDLLSFDGGTSRGDPCVPIMASTASNGK